MKNKIVILLCVLALLLTLGACSRGNGSTTAQPTEPTASEPTASETTVDAEPTEPTKPTEPIEPPQTDFRISLADTDTASIESNLELSKPVASGTLLSFTVKPSVFYEGTPDVYAGEEKLTPNAQGVYSFTVTRDTVIRVEGLQKKTSAMEGSGTSSDPYQITEPVDLLYIAERVNAGDTDYIVAFYKLMNDLDCEGKTLDVIGDGSTDSSVFAGLFNGNDKTISNYRIESDGNFIGLFGALQVETGGSGGGTITNLKLKDFTIRATPNGGDGAYVGALVGYGMGSSLILCSAENGHIEVYAATDSFSFVGGLVGCQTAMDYEGYPFYSGISYCSTDVDISCNSGLVFSAGGLVGYMAASTTYGPSYITASYATGDVSGAMRAGGLVGYMTGGTSIANSYATGSVAAQTTYADVEGFYAEFSYAYAGGLVGYAQAGCAVSGCFSASELRASSKLGDAWQITSGDVAYLAEPGEYAFGFEKAAVFNCYYARGGKDGDIDLTSEAFLKEKLRWADVDWIFHDGYPTFNLESNEDYSFVVAVMVGQEKAEFELNYYMPLHYWYTVGVPYRLTPEDGSSLFSYGYYFDEQCTQRVPDSYVPTCDITLYAALADNAAVADTYELCIDREHRAYLTLLADGTCRYDDAGKTSETTYIYDGKRILFSDARFGRFLNTEREMLHYQLYEFGAIVREDGALIIVGGEDNYSDTYFTEEAPLLALPLKKALSGNYTDGTGIYTFYADGTGIYQNDAQLCDLVYTFDGSTLTLDIEGKTIVGSYKDGILTLGDSPLRVPDEFRGDWSVDSKANKVYSFDGAGNWSYSYYGYTRAGTKNYKQTAYGTYTIDENGVLTMEGDLSGTAEFSENVLYVDMDGKRVSCHRDGSFYGIWTYTAYGCILQLDGIGADGQGSGRVQYIYDDGTVEFYDLSCAFDELDEDIVCLYLDDECFGFLRYLPEQDRLDATIYVGSEANFMSGVRMNSVDDLNGEWVGGFAAIPALRFNGYGAYDGGTVTIGEDEIGYAITDATMCGAFYYGDKQYIFEYNEHNESVTLTCGDEMFVYVRKDAFGDLTLTDGEHRYTFDGRGTQEGFGKFYVDGVETYGYAIEGEHVLLLSDGKIIGSILRGETDYVLTFTDSSTNLRIETRFTGDWAMSGSPRSYTVIGTMGTDGKIYGIVNGDQVVFTVYDEESLVFEYMDATYYAVYVGVDNLILSTERKWYLSSDAVRCAPLDDMYGTWKQSTLNGAYQFDGMSNSTLTSGLCQSGSLKGEEFTSTYVYYYRTDASGNVVLWTTDASGETQISRLVFCDPSTKYAFVNDDGTRAFTIEKGDRLYNVSATDDDGCTYSFDGFGKVTTSDGGVYDYSVQSIDYENGILRASITIDGVVRQIIVDFSGSEMTLRFVED